jgi:CheY-like chemotaxis protein
MKNQTTILAVEDDSNDALLLRRAFTKANVLNAVQFVSTGTDALCYLKGVGKYQDRLEFPLPGLILLDLKLPDMTGHDVLAWVRCQPCFQSLRVVVLTASTNMTDINLAYHLGANSFVSKPADLESFVQLSRALRGYWLGLDRAPEANRPLCNLSQAAS